MLLGTDEQGYLCRMDSTGFLIRSKDETLSMWQSMVWKVFRNKRKKQQKSTERKVVRWGDLPNPILVMGRTSTPTVLSVQRMPHRILWHPEVFLDRAQLYTLIKEDHHRREVLIYLLHRL